MCAIFGFVSTEERSPDPRVLARIVRANVHRGPHSFGFAWIDGAGRLMSYRHSGRLTDEMGALAMVRNARMVIGHLRWATHGDVESNINNHPHPADGGWIVHNGIVTNYRQAVVKHRLHPDSECDSEVLGLLIERTEGTLLGRTAQAISATTGYLAMLGLWSRPAAMVVACRGNPLHLADGREGMYLATLADELPGRVREFPANQVATITNRKGHRNVRLQTLAPDEDRYLPGFRGGMGATGHRGQASEYRGG